MPAPYLPYLAVARFSGADAGEFLQSQLSADILALQTGETTFACYCTPKGQVLGLLLVGCEDDSYLLAGSEALLPGILRRLQMYVLRSKVQIDSTDIRVAGNGADHAFVEAGSALSDVAGQRAAELRAGISWLNPGSSEKFIPQMLGFEAIGAVSFRKGCYPGQEIVARARYLGKVKRGPLVVETDGVPGAAPGDKVRVRRGDDWQNAVVVDGVETASSGAVLFTVSSTGDDRPVEELEFESRAYRCATT